MQQVDRGKSHVVIFRAKHKSDIGPDYVPTVLHLKEKALTEYGCSEFVYATTPDGEEIAISFWPDAESIQRWKADGEHRAQQREQMVKGKWYAEYRIQVGEIHRDYARIG